MFKTARILANMYSCKASACHLVLTELRSEKKSITTTTTTIAIIAIIRIIKKLMCNDNNELYRVLRFGGGG